MRVVIVTHRVVRGDGQGQVNYEIARHLAANEHAVLLVAGEVAPELLEDGCIRWHRATHGPIPGALLRNLWFSADSRRVLSNVREPGDVILVNGAVTSAASDINVVHFVHAGWAASTVYDPGRGWKGLYQRAYTGLNIWLERRAFRSAGVLVTVSQKVADELVAAGYPRDRIEVIHNGVDAHQFHPGAVSRAALGLPVDRPLALFVGGLGTPRKNLENVLEALAKTPALHLAVAGGGEATSYAMLARRLGVSARVHFLGPRSDIADIMRASDFLVCPSRYEPFGLVILEAMASGLPVITSASAGAAELMEEVCGLVIADPNDVVALAAAMNTMLSDLAARGAMATNARSTAERYGWSGVGERYLALCARIVAERAA